VKYFSTTLNFPIPFFHKTKKFFIEPTDLFLMDNLIRIAKHELECANCHKPIKKGEKFYSYGIYEIDKYQLVHLEVEEGIQERINICELCDVYNKTMFGNENEDSE